MERETRSRCVARHPRSNCNIYNTGNILNSIIPVLYQCIVTCMHEINYAIVLRIILHPRYQQRVWVGWKVWGADIVGWLDG